MALVLPALILLVLIGGVNLWAGSLEKRALAEFPPEGRFLSVDGTRIHYVERGAGPVVILLHGAGGSSRDFTFDLMDRLADTYRVITFDRPGLGYSDRLPGYRRFFSGQGREPGRTGPCPVERGADAGGRAGNSGGPFLWRGRGAEMGH